MSPILGLDIGNDTSVIAAIKQRSVDILLNDESSRETPSLVSFGDKQRFIGTAASSVAARFPRQTISHLKRLLNRQFSDPRTQSDLKRLPFETSESPDGQILIRVHYLREEQTFTPVQILSMLLSHLKSTAEKNLKIPVRDCVLGIPSYFTDSQRRSYLAAAEIAGLKVLRLMNDCAATALGYGIYRTESSAFNVVFVDIGHCDTQVSVVGFEGGKMRVLAHAFDADLGGRDFDEVLFEHFAEEFKERYGIKVRESVRASFRLRAACEKLKKVLSANSEAPLSVECLMEEKDVKGFIKREEFEDLCIGLLKRVLVPCKQALEYSGLKVGNINAVELVGSGSRIPSIKRLLSDFFMKEPGRTLNASECVAYGCALQGAMLSPTFKVRDYEVMDILPFPISFATEEGPITTFSSNVLLKRGQPIPTVKILSLVRAKPFKMEVFYADENELPAGASPKISCFQVGPFQVSDDERPKVKVKIRVSLHGIVFVESASLFRDDKNHLVARDTSQRDNMDIDSTSRSTDDVVVENGTSEHIEPGSLSSSDRKKTESSVRCELPITETIYGGMTKEWLLEAQEQEKQFAYQDKVVEQTKDRKNALEAFVYEVRNKLFERYRSFASDSEREGISDSLNQTENWLYDDGDDETEKVYAGKLEELKKLVDPIENRCKDEEARAQATRELLKCIVDFRMAVNSVTTYERDLVANECNKAEQWLREKTMQQESLPKNTDPVLWSHEIKKRTEALETACRTILRHKGSSRPDDPKDSDHPSGMQTD